MAGAAVDASGIKTFARQMYRVERKLGVATAAELRAIGNKERDKVRAGTDAPRAASPSEDSEGKPGRKRQSVKTSVRAGGVSLYSREPDAGVWNWGGTIKPKGSPIQIPRTEFVSGQVQADATEIAAALGDLPVALARRYAEFK